DLPGPLQLQAGDELDGYRIVQELHASSRSHVYRAIDGATGATVALKIPSLDLRHDPAYLERLLMEEWIARRIDSRHVVKAWAGGRPRHYLYTVSEYMAGLTLACLLQVHPEHEHFGVADIHYLVFQHLHTYDRHELPSR